MPVETIPTTGRGTATGIARNAIERGADLILVAGGDGTINEVVNGMVHSEVPLGILPAGTANVLATELGAGKTMEQAAEALLDCTEERIALGLLSTQAPLTDVRGSVESVRYRAATGGSVHGPFGPAKSDKDAIVALTGNQGFRSHLQGSGPAEAFSAP
jgi:hypothetical protein